jgi:glycerol-3-phosphate dehydrogenase
MAAELHPEYDDAQTRAALNDLSQERWKGQRHALWGDQLSQAMLNYALHATTMNRDRDPAACESPIDFAAFDDGSARGQVGDSSTATGDGGVSGGD